MSVFDRIRNEFPELARIIHLNSAALSLMPECSKQALVAALADRELTSEARTALRVGRDLDARQKIGRLINAPAETICVVANTSEGLNVAAQGLDFRPGENVVLSENEFVGNIVPWLNLASKGVLVKRAAVPFGQDPAAAIRAAVDTRTKVVALSLVGWIDGFKTDVAALGRFCRERDILFVVDGIQGVGAVGLDVAASHIDFLACGAQKWLMSPNGTGFLYASKNILPRIRQKYMGYLSLDSDADNAFDFEIRPRTDASRFHLGSYNDKGIAALGRSLSLILEAGIAEVQKHVVGLNVRAAAGLRQKGYTIVSSLDPDHMSGILTFRGADTASAYERLISRGIVVSLRNGWIRISPHVYSNGEDIDRLLAAL
ncbi:MAG TPA: aminotransferase class V-fold PLP-dependent enzyme [Candidatus Aminicenantes bacterium]|nr:aminotransferase class V-fold PLP-dependent enzyme [Candidatus Aminicenantes bacterium]HRY65847.1 aminotransferase class V-fold PLP-dependent enzyme [Candidatus Aminicenantes bacterium]HRZ72827.1 aminotransferase class V-fold PLP-dependent enzyme [Candidatus Aminicenantes bacterium]